MGRLEVNGFLTELTRFYEKGSARGSAVVITMKRSDLKPKTKKQARLGGAGASGGHLCLVRASCGKDKISTTVSEKDHVYFQRACNTICKANMDALKKRERIRKKKNKK